MSEGKKLLESVDCKKGITLNSQLVDLLSILDNTNISIEEQDKQIIKYIEDLKQLQIEYHNAKEKGRSEQYKLLIDKVLNSIDDISML